MLDHKITEVAQDGSEWKVTFQPNGADESSPQSTISSKHIILSTDYADNVDGVVPERDVLEMSHAVVILDSSIVLPQFLNSPSASTEVEDDGEGVARPEEPVVKAPSLLFIPPKEGNAAIYGMLQGVETAATPVGKYILYLYTVRRTTPESDLYPSIVELLQVARRYHRASPNHF
ncbi:hypothetical protein BJ742DRAFT_106196 [Cladochytrium replicatum]|nr:hypothetical protein BJ742DRAFT_106196 [Cladochytrium replicatum]